MSIHRAPGAPGSIVEWTPGKKEAVGTASNLASHAWFTLSDGIFNETFYPRIDCSCTRDMQMVVTDGASYFSEEKRNTESTTRWMETGVPAFQVVNVEREGKYRIEKQILTDPERPVILQRTRFVPQQGKLSNYHLFVLLAPFLANESINTAWVGEYKGFPVLMAEHNGVALALACSTPWQACSAGYVGVSDGWQDLSVNKKMTWNYTLAENGNVALTGEIDIQSCDGEFLLALGFGRTAQEAAHHARASLVHGYEAIWLKFHNEWQDWHESLLSLDTVEEDHRNPYRISTTMLHCHESTDFPGSTVPSLSIPWGLTQGHRDAGGYHLVWPRDAFEAASAFMAAGAYENAQRILEYMETTQEPEGYWPKCMWLDGRPFRKGVELDEVAAPILLIELARRERMLAEGEISRLWPMIRKAAGFIVRSGPAARQDRWEEQTGYSPYTLAISIASLLSAAEIADENEPSLALYLRQTADCWNESIEDWTYVMDTELSRRNGVDGYYMRIAPYSLETGLPIKDGLITIRHSVPPNNQIMAAKQVSPDALALVRFGLRSADDPRILSTLRVIDSVLKTETPFGPCWHRFNGDGYGEKADGSRFDGTGIGRLWPVLTGERAHYELAAGNLREARRLLSSLEKFSDRTGMLSEQIWDSPDLPHMGLYLGKPTGSARPFVWAHAEHVKLLRSLRDQGVFDMPVQSVQRYLVEATEAEHTLWRTNLRTPTVRPGQKLRIETFAPVQVHWSADNWLTVHDVNSCDTRLGIHITDLTTQELPEEAQVNFTLYWPEKDQWEGKDFSVQVRPPEHESISEEIAEQRAIHKPRPVRRVIVYRRQEPRSKLRERGEGEEG